MKHIAKQEPQIYRDLIEKHSPAEWGGVSQAIGYDLRMHMLMEEQNCQCAYTELHLEPEDAHIDHFRKQSLFQSLKFDWNNLLTSCNCEAYGAKCKDRKVRKQDDYNFLIDPVVDEPEDHYTYSLTGDMLADENDRKAVNTIECFNLNDSALLEQRKQVVREMEVMYKQFSVEELVELFGKFESLVRAVYSDLEAIERLSP